MATSYIPLQLLTLVKAYFESGFGKTGVADVVDQSAAAFMQISAVNSVTDVMDADVDQGAFVMKPIIFQRVSFLILCLDFVSKRVLVNNGVAQK